jgi:PAS domain S-box-containing protein
VSVIITDLSGRIMWVNPQFLRNTGYALAEVVGKALAGVQRHDLGGDLPRHVGLAAGRQALERTVRQPAPRWLDLPRPGLAVAGHG